MNEQLNPQSPHHLRHDPMVEAWIADYQSANKWRKFSDCRLCGWPHGEASACGCGATFGRLRLGREYTYIHTGNVAWQRQFMNTLSERGFHWQCETFFKRVGSDVVVSYISYFNGNPSFEEWKIPVAEFASIVCAVSVGGETSEQYQQAVRFLNEPPVSGSSLAGRGLNLSGDALAAPCRWCGYNGERYWQQDTHGPLCPWRHIGGEDRRRILFATDYPVSDSLLGDARRLNEEETNDALTRTGELDAGSPPQHASPDGDG